jgi:hypothetical protein
MKTQIRIKMFRKLEPLPDLQHFPPPLSTELMQNDHQWLKIFKPVPIIQPKQ